MRVRVWATPQAAAHLRQIATWWGRNRPAARNMFLDEFESAVSLLSEMPDIGRRYRRASVPGLRRWLLSRSRYHVYYVHDEVAAEVIILAIWSAVRGRPPYIIVPPRTNTDPLNST